MKRIYPWIWIVVALFFACAAPQEFIEEEYIDEGPVYTETQVDSIVRYNRMFFWDYYQPMARKSEFSVQGCETAMDYFWQYVEFDTAKRFNDFGQAANCYIEWSKLDETKADSARIVYEMGSERYPDSDYLHNALGIIYKNRGDLELAEKHYLAAHSIDPDNADYLIPLTEIFQQNQEWQEAKDACEKVLAIDPGNTTIRDRLENFTPEEYIAALKDKIALDPDNIDNHIKLASLYLNQGKNDEALQAANDALEVDPKNVEVLEIFGRIQENFGKYNGAIEAYKRILETDPNRVDIILDIASNLKSLDNYKSARTYVLKALKVSPGNGAAYLKFGEIYEASADKSSRNKQATYDDKLVFTIAYGLFEKSANSDDYNVKDNASRKMKYLDANQILPQKSDWFMHQTETVPQGEGYKWIDDNWSEVKYIKTYLKKFTG